MANQDLLVSSEPVTSGRSASQKTASAEIKVPVTVFPKDGAPEFRGRHPPTWSKHNLPHGVRQLSTQARIFGCKKDKGAGKRGPR
jgi:hypothetical protein